MKNTHDWLEQRVSSGFTVVKCKYVDENFIKERWDSYVWEATFTYDDDLCYYAFKKR